MPQRFARISRVALAIAVLGGPGCRGTDARLQQHQEEFESISSTTVAIGEAWLGGHVSGTYARASLERAFVLLEQERAKLAGTPDDLLDPRGARLSEATERLGRLLAALVQDVRLGDADNLRRHLKDVRPGRVHR